MELEVWLDQNLVGHLTHDGRSNRFSFAYAPEWANRRDTFSLSPELPVVRPADVTPDSHSAVVRQFFENLLPEGQALDDAAAAYKVSKSNLTGLLAALGRETAGALRLCVAGAEQEPEIRRLVSPAELSLRTQQRPQLPFTVWDGRVRLSIAGYQDKLAVLAEGADWFLVEGANLASTHILKPEPVNPDLAGLTSNEFFCMRLAEAVGLDVAQVHLHLIPEPILSITRFDRLRVERTVRRLHAIDGCQLLGLPTSFKYERPYGDSRDVKHIRDGASLPRLFHALNRSPVPALQRQRLLRWVIFQVLIGNTDAHAKNLTFFMGPGGPEMAPAYDLVCGKVFGGDHLDMTYAMAIGDAFTAEGLSPYEWALFCVTAGVNPLQLRKELERLARAVLAHMTGVADAVIRSGASPAVVKRIVAELEPECERQLGFAPEVKGMISIATG